MLKVYEKWAYKNADYIFCISREDQKEMITQFDLDPGKCLLVPYGITINHVPVDKKQCREQIIATHQIPTDNAVLFFNGLLNYKPNLEALDFILYQLNTELQKRETVYTIIIAGNKLPATYNNLEVFKKDNILFTGFVKDIDTYTKAADVMLNPVTTGGGVKTKLIDALAMNTTVVSTRSGAIGIDKEICGNKLVIVDDFDSAGFADAIINSFSTSFETPASFYDHHYWKHITARIKKFLPPHE
jgi:glycosyltransferase involved in cell wall biosynthesis